MKRIIPKPNLYIDMYSVIGDLVHEYGVPLLCFEDLVQLGIRTTKVYNLDSKVPFEVLCLAIKNFISTPFGNKMLLELSKH